MFYKKACYMLAVLVLLVSFPACNAKSEENGSIDEKGRKVITFTCAELSSSDEGIIKIAAQVFEKENPNAAIKVRNLSKQGYGIDKYLSTINAELMSGKGPDIMPITYFPALKYFEKNVFANLNEMISKDKDFNSKKYMENVLEASKFKGNLYAIPVYFGFKGIIASKETLDKDSIKINDKSWTTNDFISYANKVTKDLNGDGKIDRYALPKIPMNMVTNLFISTDKFVDYENKKANFESEQFIELLKLLQMLSDNKLIDKNIKLGDTIPYKKSQEVVFSGVDINGYRNILGQKYGLGGGTRVLLRLPTITKTEGLPFESNMMLAINNHSKNKEYAWKFLKILLSDKIQNEFAGASSTAGFPISKDALELQKKNVLSLDWRVKDDSLGWVRITFTNDEFNFIDEYIKDISRYRYGDSRVEKIVSDEIYALFSNSLSFKKKDAEDVAKAIQRKVKLYLDE